MSRNRFKTGKMEPMETVTITPKLPKLFECPERGKETVYVPYRIATFADVEKWAKGLKARKKYTIEREAAVEMLRPVMKDNPTMTVPEGVAIVWENVA